VAGKKISSRLPDFEYEGQTVVQITIEGQLLFVWVKAYLLGIPDREGSNQ
jgi:hypothetical protein